MIPVINAKPGLGRPVGRSLARLLPYWGSLLILILLGVSPLRGFGQVAFDVPAQIEFAGITLRLDEDARQKVRNHGQALITNNRYYRAMTERADLYFPLIERELSNEQVPEAFKYLPIQESGLVSDVTSSSQAVGYWQFKAATATEHGLRVDGEVDERMHILASTRAAARYLKKHNGYLNNWVHTLLSYYAGLGGARSLIDPREAGVTQMQLTGQTHFYILKYLATRLAFEQVVNRSPNPALVLMEYPDCEGRSLRQIAQQTNIAYDQVVFYNKWCRSEIVPTDRDYTVILPVAPMATTDRPAWAAMTTRPPAPTAGPNLRPWRERTFFGLIERGPDPSATADAAGQPGAGEGVFFSWNGIKAIMARRDDNLDKLALASGISRQDLIEYNDLRVFDLVIPGQTYYVRPKRRKARVGFHTARPGETLWEISQSYGVTLRALLRKNRMSSPEKLEPGQIVWLRQIRPRDQPVEYDRTVAPPPTIVPVSTPLRTQTQASAVAYGSGAGAGMTELPARTPAYSQGGAYPETSGHGGYSQPQAAPSNPAGFAQAEARLRAEPAPSPPPAAVFDPSVDPDGLVESPAPNSAPAPVTAPTPAPTPAPTAPKPAAMPAPKTTPVPASAAPSPTPKPAPATTAPSTGAIEKKPFKGSNPEAVSIPKAAFMTHTVEVGQTIFAISRLYGVRADSLLAWNPAAANGLSVGAVVRYRPGVGYVTPIPASVAAREAAYKPVATTSSPTASTAQASKPALTAIDNDLHTVAAGETCYALARRYNLTVARLLELNGWTTVPTLSIGQGVKVK